MKDLLNQFHSPSSPVIEVSEQYPSLNPCVELAKCIMDAAVCEINIFNSYYQSEEVRDIDVVKPPSIDSICYDTVRHGMYEIEDLRESPYYKDHSYVKDASGFRYYCGTKLTTSGGTDVGSICVLDSVSRRASEEQKEQLRQLAHLVMNIIENESKNYDSSRNANAADKRIHKLNHDMRTPITGIIGITDMLMQSRKQAEFPADEIKMVKDSAETILDLIDDVLENIDTKQNGQEKKDVHPLDNIMNQLKSLYNPPAKVKELSLTFTNHVDPGLNIPHSFGLRLLQITSNLVSNAVKFTPENGTVNVEITQASDENYILDITVSNTGSHIPADQVKAFNNGQSVERSFGTNREQSFGIGLKHVKQLVDQSGGTISVRSERGDETKFIISLPVPEMSTDISITTRQREIKKPKTNGSGEI